MQAGRLPGTLAFDGVEIAKGLAAIDQLRDSGEIDAYYAGAAKRAYEERAETSLERPAPFETPSPFGAPLAPGALARRYGGQPGAPVGPSVAEACRCTPRKFDARDPLSGWGIYYVNGGVLLTPTEKCIGGSGGPLSFWRQTWRNVLALLPPALAPAAPPPPKVEPHPQPPGYTPPPAASVPGGFVQVCKPGYVAEILASQLAAYEAAGWRKC